MLTDQEIQDVANHYISFLMNRHNVEFALYDNSIKKDYGNLYYYNTKQYVEAAGLEHIMSFGPFLVEKETGRVVTFGTAYPVEYYFEAYENGTLEPTLTRYWHPDEEKYSHE